MGPHDAQHDARTDQAQADRERAARQHLLDRGAGDALVPRPWQQPPIPPSAADLVQFVLWRSATGDAAPDDALAALRLFPAARAELDQAETGLLFAARGFGLTWATIADAVGLRSPQAAQQRLDRRVARRP